MKENYSENLKSSDNKKLGQNSNDMSKNSYEKFDCFLSLAVIGDGRGKLAVVEMLEPLIISSIKRYCPIMREYEDLHSDGVEIVLHLIDTWDGKRSFLAYAKAYLKYHYLKTFKYLLDIEEDIHENDEEDSLFDTFVSCDNIEEDFLIKEQKGLLQKAIDKLSDRQRQVIILYYYERLGLSEIGTYLGISKWTVVNLKRNAIKNLKKHLMEFKE